MRHQSPAAEAMSREEKGTAAAGEAGNSRPIRWEDALQRLTKGGWFWVEVADAIPEEAANLGGAMVVPPFDAQISRDAVIADPRGAVFSVSTAPGP